MSSFFGFDTTLPEHKSPIGRPDTEEAYDALNDETFGHATREDWEPLHEDLVRIETSRLSKNDDSEDYDSDLDINFDRLKLDDCDIANDDFDSNIRTQLDPSVWTCSEKSLLTSKTSLSNNLQKVQSQTPTTQFNNVFTESDFLRQSYALQQQQLQQQQQQQQKFQTMGVPQSQPPSQANLAQQTSLLKQLIGAQPSQPSGMLSLEEIERNMINQQQQQQQHKMIQEKLAELQAKMPRPAQPQPQPQNQQQQQQQQMRNVMNNQQQKAPQATAPPLMANPPPGANRQTMFPPHPLLNPVPRVPPGFQVPPGPPGANIGKFNPMMPMPNHPGMNMNHFVHPGAFGGPIQRPQPPQPMPPNPMNRMPPHLMNMQQQPPQMGMAPTPMGQQGVNQNQTQNTAQFNQRLVQEIQQNHPMLSFNRNQQQQQQQQQQQHHHNHHHNVNGNHQQVQQQRYNPKLEEFDEYANLMTTREKQFLITIQVMQLNTETPYFDDFYYTVYKERQKEKGINNETSAHKDNQMNHPFTQPKDHAHMLLRQFGNLNMNKNGMNQKNGIRERKNSESSTKNDQNNKEPTPRTYTPLQFENSLGKLQCGSVTAPRKIIDMEIIDNSEGGNSSSSQVFEPTTQRKTRQLLLHVETLYKIVLKLEDLQNPMAIAAAVILKEKREKEKHEKEKEQEFAMNDTTHMKSDVLCSSSTKSSISINEPEGLNELLPKLLAMLQLEKITGMMSIRKGRVLLKRIMPHIKDNAIRWDVWSSIFASLNFIKRDKLEEIEDTLMPLYYEFANHLQNADFKDVLKVVHVFVGSQKLLGFVNGCKFIVSSVIAMIIQSELLFIKSSDYINQTDHDEWLLFLTKLCDVTASADLNSLTLAYSLHKENNNEKVIKTVVSHFKRFTKIDSTDSDKLVKILSLQFDVK